MLDPKSRTLTRSSTLVAPPKEKKPVASLFGMARPTPELPSKGFCQATWTRKRLPARQRVSASGEQGSGGSRKPLTAGKVEAKAPSRVDCAGLQLSESPQPP